MDADERVAKRAQTLMNRINDFVGICTDAEESDLDLYLFMLAVREIVRKPMKDIEKGQTEAALTAAKRFVKVILVPLGIKAFPDIPDVE